MEMLQRTEAPEGYFAGMLTGRGGFGVDSTGEPWLSFTALDHGVVEEALELWGGHVRQKRNGHGMSRFKYTAGPRGWRRYSRICCRTCVATSESAPTSCSSI